MFRLPEPCRQLLLCLAADWSASAGRLRRYQRVAGGADWQPLGDDLAVTLGRAGLAWGRGLHPAPAAGELLKCEGDGRAPAGVFALSALFGAPGAPSVLAQTAQQLPYLAATPDLKCIDDPCSAYYNRIVGQSAVARPDWASCEDMLRGDERYALGVVVAHNTAPVVAGAGSCIFLHVWAAPDAPTAGCTAMAPADLQALAGWLDATAAPLLVLLPQLAYERHRAAWGLPAWPA